MARNIEILLRVAADMDHFEHGTPQQQKTLFSHAFDELTEFDLDLVAAAALGEYAQITSPNNPSGSSRAAQGQGIDPFK